VDLHAVPATVADRPAVVATIVAAFVNDPAFRFFFPDDATYDRYAAAFAGYLFDRRVRRGTVWMAAGGAVVALWEKPEVFSASAPQASPEVLSASAPQASPEVLSASAPQASPAVLSASAPQASPEVAPTPSVTAEAPRLDLPAAELDRIRAYDAAVEAVLPTYPHWYLGVLATRPDHAGRGLGRRLMAHGVARAHADGLPAVLETMNPSNVDLYVRAGWQVYAETTAADVPRTWVLVNPPVLAQDPDATARGTADPMNDGATGGDRPYPDRTARAAA
jgi:GNAT superfamily N-acetyltransferase